MSRNVLRDLLCPGAVGDTVAQSALASRGGRIKPESGAASSGQWECGAVPGTIGPGNGLVAQSEQTLVGGWAKDSGRIKRQSACHCQLGSKRTQEYPWRNCKVIVVGICLFFNVLLRTAQEFAFSCSQPLPEL